MVVLNSKRIVVADRQNSSANCWYCRGNRVIGEILFDLCQDCSKMPSIPQGAFAACKMREQLKQDMTVARFQNGEKQEPRKDFNNKKLMEYTPVKYNSKLMNSIWGLYNRYSPHNIKGVDEEAARSQSFLQQPQTVAYAIANKISMAPGKEWIFSGKK